jgi:acyl carrier protein
LARSTGEAVSFEEFASAIAEVARVPVSSVGQRTPLLDGLGLDSLSLTELIVMLMFEFDMESLSNRIEARDWSRVTVGQLYDEYRNGPRAVRAGERLVFRGDGGS